jgi:hypothetical protein
MKVLILFLFLFTVTIVGEELELFEYSNFRQYTDKTEEIKIRCQQIQLDDETQNYFDCFNFVPRPLVAPQRPEKVKCHQVTQEDGRSHFICPSTSTTNGGGGPGKEKVKCRQIENIDGSLSFDCGMRRVQSKEKVKVQCAQVSDQDGNLRFDCGNTLTAGDFDSNYATATTTESCKEIRTEDGSSVRYECFGYSFTIKEPTKPRADPARQGQHPSHSSEFKQETSSTSAPSIQIPFYYLLLAVCLKFIQKLM